MTPYLFSKKPPVKDETLTVVQCDDVQAVEQLSFVLVDPLHVDIKHGVGVDLHLVLLFKIGSKLHLVLLKVEATPKNVIRNRKRQEYNHLPAGIFSLV